MQARKLEREGEAWLDLSLAGKEAVTLEEWI
jgi:hypothetical protein